jgi:hypothetical protein
MCPDGEGPGFVADKVGVEAGNGKVAHAFIGASVVDFSDSYPLTVVAHQQVAGSQLAGSYPTTTVNIERMLRRGADDLPTGQVQVPNASDVLEASLAPAKSVPAWGTKWGHQEHKSAVRQ